MPEIGHTIVSTGEITDEKSKVKHREKTGYIHWLYPNGLREHRYCG
jgi:hypothetical protein